MADREHSRRRHTPRFPANSMTASSSFRPTPCPCACGATANARTSASVSSCASSLAGPNGSSVIVPRMPLPASPTATSTTQPSAKPNPRSVSAYPLPPGSSPSARYATTRSSPTAAYSSGRACRIFTDAGYPQVAGPALGLRCRPEQCRRTGAADRAHHRSARGPHDRRGNGLPGDHARSSNGGDHQVDAPAS